MAAAGLTLIQIVLLIRTAVGADDTGKMCLFDSDCPPDTPCRDNACVDPCGKCGNNTLCQIVDFTANCSCKPGYSRGPDIDPRFGGQEQEEFTDCVPSACSTDTDCPEGMACTDYKCGDPCALCGLNTDCTVLVHDPYCSCKPGYISNAVQGRDGRSDDSFSDCVPDLSTFCFDDSNCAPDELCSESQCSNPCPKGCGKNAVCQVVDHALKCDCKPGYSGDPTKNCSQSRPQPGRCLTNTDCPLNMLCSNQMCRLSCQTVKCGANTACIVREHLAMCECMPGFTGDPEKGCVVDVSLLSRCTINSDCPLNMLCDDQMCRLSCETVQCGANTACIIRDHLPICECMPGFNGNPYRGCSVDYVPSCNTDLECPMDKTCVNQDCEDTCRNVTCTSNADCQAVNHEAACVCRPGFMESAVSGCVSMGSGDPNCTTDFDCPTDQACVNQDCEDPCRTVTCTANADCRAMNHEATCVCRPGFVETADTGCVSMDIPGCVADQDCELYEACIDQVCDNPCGRVTCSNNSRCDVTNHKAVCRCRDGFIQDQYDSCWMPTILDVECAESYDCPEDRVCLGRRCEDPCRVTACGHNARCRTVNHRVSCECLSGYPSNGCRVPQMMTPYIPDSPKTKRFYLVTDTVTSWKGAMWHCQRRGGRLASVESEEENRTILNIIHRSGFIMKHIWIAGTDQGHEGHWTWATTGRPISGFSYWQSRQPNNLFPGQHCLGYCYMSVWGVFAKQGYWWNDHYCNVPSNFICEFYV